jgi:hypothetical protein
MVSVRSRMITKNVTGKSVMRVFKKCVRNVVRKGARNGISGKMPERVPGCKSLTSSGWTSEFVVNMCELFQNYQLEN